ncbi:hypothetical protein V1264_009643 [Littorina saxatilis]|uniref:Uncharacterized protein n=1 Tax=Littorina saxatilis TaxID=31220 RepID=A0AAN9AT09_9CAEN
MHASNPTWPYKRIFDGMVLVPRIARRRQRRVPSLKGAQPQLLVKRLRVTTEGSNPKHQPVSPTFDTLRRQTWPSEVELREKLWGTAASLRLTAGFALNTGLDI